MSSYLITKNTSVFLHYFLKHDKTKTPVTSAVETPKRHDYLSLFFLYFFSAVYLIYSRNYATGIIKLIKPNIFVITGKDFKDFCLNLAVVET